MSPQKTVKATEIFMHIYGIQITSEVKLIHFSTYMLG